MMPPPPLIVIGGSAGALSALLELVPSLPGDFPAPLLVVIHTPSDQPSYLPAVLTHAGALAAEHARHGERPEPGRIYIAPPDHHLLVAGDHLHLARGPRENLARPAIDPLFRSAAQAWGAGVIGVLLSGMLNDGASGLWTVKQLGGRVIVQDPGDAEYPEMPRSAVRQVRVDHVLRARDIGPHLRRLVAEEGAGGEEPGLDQEQWRRLRAEVGIAAEVNAFESGMANRSAPSAFTCPECHGVLAKIREGNATRFRCHTGHAYTAEALLADTRRAVEGALWSAVRVLDEQAMLLEHLGEQAGPGEERAGGLSEEAQESREWAQQVRRITLRVAAQDGAEERERG